MKFLVATIFLICLPVMLLADKVALVIGNSKYASVSELDNPHNDSVAVTAALRQQGFEVVSANDLGRVAMRDALRRFRDKADQSRVALVYYAGHGIEISGENYLVPVDARLEDERDAELEMIELDLVLRQISGARDLKMVVLDACRNNPFVVKMKRRNSGRSVSSGLGRIEYADADTLIAYAAAAGEVTPDGASGGNSPFTSAFVRALDGPPTDVRRLLGRVRDHMRDTVPGAAPFVYTSLGGGEFIINPKGAKAAPPARVAPKPTPNTSATQPSQSSISQDFIAVDRAGTFEDWDAFLIKHESQSAHPLYAFALEKREALRPTSVSRQTPEPKPETTAVVPQPIPEIAPVIEQVMTEDEAARSLQTLLKERGCYRGAIDGQFGKNSRAALVSFGRQAGATVPFDRDAGAAGLLAAAGVVKVNPNVICPKQSVARRTNPKPATRVTPQQAKPAPVVVAPSVAVAAPKASTGQKVDTRDDDSTTSPYARKDASKPVPYTPSDCIGTRSKLFDCD